jgi:hypothetical protein
MKFVSPFGNNQDKRPSRPEGDTMNFQDAIVAHLKWKDRLKQFLSGTGEALNLVLVARDDQCDLGKWIHGEGKHQYGSVPLYNTMKTAHAHFHETAAEVIKTAKAGNADKARTMLAYGGAYYSASSACVNAITHLRDHVHAVK